MGFHAMVIYLFLDYYLRLGKIIMVAMEFIIALSTTAKLVQKTLFQDKLSNLPFQLFILRIRPNHPSLGAGLIMLKEFIMAILIGRIIKS